MYPNKRRLERSAQSDNDTARMHVRNRQRTTTSHDEQGEGVSDPVETPLDDKSMGESQFVT